MTLSNFGWVCHFLMKLYNIIHVWLHHSDDCNQSIYKQVVRAIYITICAKVWSNGDTSSEVKSILGVKQRCPFFPTPFWLHIDGLEAYLDKIDKDSPCICDNGCHSPWRWWFCQGFHISSMPTCPISKHVRFSVTYLYFKSVLGYTNYQQLHHYYHLKTLKAQASLLISWHEYVQ